MALTNSSNQSTPWRNALISRRTDFWLWGGLSIALWLAVYISYLPPSSLSGNFAHITRALPSLGGALFILVAYPHLILSYWLGYKMPVQYLRKNWFPFFVGPAALFALLVGTFLAWKSGGATVLSGIFTAFVILSGWHAGKQVFGVVLLQASYEKYPITSGFRKALLSHVWSIFIWDALNLNLPEKTSIFHGIQFQPLGVPTWTLSIAAGLWGTSLISLLWLGLRIFKTSKILPTLNLILPVVAFYVWVLPTFYFPEFSILYPNISHSLQYLPFVYRVGVAGGPSTLVFRRYLKPILIYCSAILVGWLLLVAAPTHLDQIFTSRQGINGGFFQISFYIFINLHHYMIDSAIWKFNSGSNYGALLRSNPENKNAAVQKLAA